MPALTRDQRALETPRPAATPPAVVASASPYARVSRRGALRQYDILTLPSSLGRILSDCEASWGLEVTP